MQLCDMDLETYIQCAPESTDQGWPASIYQPGIRGPGYLMREERIVKWRGVMSIMFDIIHGVMFLHAYHEVH